MNTPYELTVEHTLTVRWTNAQGEPMYTALQLDGPILDERVCTLVGETMAYSHVGTPPDGKDVAAFIDHVDLRTALARQYADILASKLLLAAVE